MRRILIACALAAATAWGVTAPAAAQATAADSAGVLLDAARRLEAEGRRDAAAALLRFILDHYGGTPAAADAQTRLGEVRQRAAVSAGRGELMVWYTLYGAWLGVALPAALGADEPEPFGVGLLIGGPVGFLASRGYARSTRVTSGQARAIAFGSQWGTWQGAGWRAALDLGNRTETVCFGPGGSPPCDTFETQSERAPWTAMVIGGLTGMTAAALLARGRDIPSGRATFAIHGGYWGTWYGLASSILFDVEDGDQALTWVLLGGNLGLLAGALAGPDGISSGRTWLITAGGVAGLAAGFGVDLLVQPDDDKAAIAIPMVTSAVGLVAAMGWTRAFDAQQSRDGDLRPGAALFNVRGGRLSLGIPAVAPTVMNGPGAHGRRTVAWRVPLFELRH